MQTGTVLAKSVEIDIHDKKYEVPFPNTGEYMDIRNRISIYINDLVVRDAYDTYASLLAEMICTYNVMIPDLKKDINVDSILKLSMIESKELLDSYINVYKPFFDSWMKIVMEPKAK